ncbi:MAG: hypothetical protein QOI95_1412 [Acidimicrobiaceae bacterium]|jgi:hypothetical protein
MNRSRLRRWALVVLGGAMTSVAAGSAWQSAHAGTTVRFGSYTIAATAPGFEMWEDEPSANAHPEGGGQAPYSTSALGSGGVGYGLSSIAWPGATEANADKVGLLLFPHDATVPNGPTVQVPDAVVGLFNTAAPAANYPIRAESRTGSGSPDSAFDAQGATLKAHADPVLAQATATMKGADGQANFGFGNAETIANSVMNDTTGSASADSRITNIDLGGVIKIDSVASHAEAATDGVTAGAPTGSTVVQGMTIAGQPAYVDEQGVHIGEQGQPANAIVSQIANQALTQGGFSFFIAQPQQEQSGSTASYTAGSLIIQWIPPSNPSQNVFFIALGGSRVLVTATPGQDFSLPGSAPFVPSTFTPASPASPARPGITSSPATSASPTGAKATPANTLGSKPIAATFDGLAGQVILGLLGSGLMFFGFKRVADDIVDRPPSSCPLETT